MNEDVFVDMLREFGEVGPESSPIVPKCIDPASHVVIVDACVDHSTMAFVDVRTKV